MRLYPGTYTLRDSDRLQDSLRNSSTLVIRFAKNDNQVPNRGGICVNDDDPFQSNLAPLNTLRVGETSG